MSLPSRVHPFDSHASGVAGRFATVHRDALAVLTGWGAPDDAQDALRASFVRHLRDHPDGVAKAGPPAHLTVGCLVLDPRGERVLLTHHAKTDGWYQFGGHAEARDRTLHAAAARELAEESGVGGLDVSAAPVHLDLHSLPATYEGCRWHLDVRYAAVAPPDATPVTSAESHDVRWWAVSDLPPEAASDLAALIAAARAWLASDPGEANGRARRRRDAGHSA
ncbi:MAG: NUDIX domain-containing protein [Dermatophilaceae bacterium]